MAKRLPGKVFDTLKYRDHQGGVTIDVPVRMVKDEGKYVGSSTTYKFVVRMDDFGIHDSDADLNKLRDRVFEEIRKKRSTEWEDFLHVFAGGRFSCGYDPAPAFAEEGHEHLGIDGLLRLDVRPTRVGTRYDGSKVYSRGDGHRASEGFPCLGKGEEPWRGTSDRIYGTYALVPDTPENRKALAEIIAAMQRVEAMLKKIVDPDNIHAALEQIRKGSGPLGLPAPQKEE